MADSADRGLGDRRCARLRAVGRSDLPGGCPVAADPDQGPGGCQCQRAVCPDSAGSAGSRRQRAGSLLRQAGVFRSPSRAIPAIERRGLVPRAGFLEVQPGCLQHAAGGLEEGPPGGAFLPLVHAVSPGHGWCRHSQRHARVDHRERASANPGRPPGAYRRSPAIPRAGYRRQACQLPGYQGGQDRPVAGSGQHPAGRPGG